MFTSRSAEETVRFGREYAQRLLVGDVVAVTGELGAGKTQFIKGVVAGLGSNDDVTSPTFTLVHEYASGRLPVYHFDFYRLDKAEEALQLGFDEYLHGDGVSLIEWADRFPQLMPAATTWIKLRPVTDDERTIEISSSL